MVYRTFTQTYDMNTEQGAPTLLGIHTPIGGDMWRFLYPFFMAYKKFKYVGCDITIVNSARLPVDPEQVGKIDGQNYVAPQDTLNPIMFKGCHGESLGKILDSMYGGLTSDIFKSSGLDKETFNAVLENFYYTALGDDGWRKSPVQKTLRLRGLHPLVYNIATQHQILPSNGMLAQQYVENTYSEFADGSNDPTVTPQSGGFGVTGGVFKSPTVANTKVFDPYNNVFVNKQVGSIFTNKASRLGWMDTMQFVGSTSKSDVMDSARITELPKIFMGLLMLPPAYLTRQYLRVIIQHKIRFSGYRTITTGGNVVSPVGYSHGYYDYFTGNIPEGNTKSVDTSDSSGSAAGLRSAADPEDGVDYDAIEEVDDDGDC